VSTEKQGERRFFLSVLYIFYYRTIHTPNMHNANSFRVYRAIVLFPIFWHFSEDSSSATTICGSLEDLSKLKMHVCPLCPCCCCCCLP
jgi:hypothetical protein